MIEDREEIDRRVTSRIHRQAVLRKRGGPTFVAIVTESALRNHVGSREVMRDQLRFLAEVAERPNITLRVVPRSVGSHPGLNGSFMRLRFAERTSVVYFGNLTSSQFLEEPSDIYAYDRTIGGGLRKVGGGDGRDSGVTHAPAGLAKEQFQRR